MSTDNLIAANDKVEMFTFGDPTPVLDSNQLFYFGECHTINGTSRLLTWKAWLSHYKLLLITARLFM